MTFNIIAETVWPTSSCKADAMVLRSVSCASASRRKESFNWSVKLLCWKMKKTNTKRKLALRTATNTEIAVKSMWRSNSQMLATRPMVCTMAIPKPKTKASAHLSPFDTKDFHQEVVAPATDSAFHGEAVFTRMLLQQR